jgi:hypothetical protein
MRVPLSQPPFEKRERVKLKGALASYYCACVKKGGVRVGFGGWWSPFAFCFSAFFIPFLQRKEFLFFLSFFLSFGKEKKGILKKFFFWWGK